MDGVALAERVRAERPGLPVVVISANDDPSVAARARDAGARAFLPKTGLAATLPAALREVLRGGGHPDDGRSDDGAVSGGGAPPGNVPREDVG